MNFASCALFASAYDEWTLTPVEPLVFRPLVQNHVYQDFKFYWALGEGIFMSGHPCTNKYPSGHPSTQTPHNYQPYKNATQMHNFAKKNSLLMRQLTASTAHAIVAIPSSH